MQTTRGQNPEASACYSVTLHTNVLTLTALGTFTPFSTAFTSGMPEPPGLGSTTRGVTTRWECQDDLLHVTASGSICAPSSFVLPATGSTSTANDAKMASPVEIDVTAKHAMTWSTLPVGSGTPTAVEAHGPQVKVALAVSSCFALLSSHFHVKPTPIPHKYNNRQAIEACTACSTGITSILCLEFKLKRYC